MTVLGRRSGTGDTTADSKSGLHLSRLPWDWLVGLSYSGDQGGRHGCLGRTHWNHAWNRVKSNVLRWERLRLVFNVPVLRHFLAEKTAQRGQATQGRSHSIASSEPA